MPMVERPWQADGASVKIRRSALRVAGAMPGAHEGYVSWERFEAIRTMVSSNIPTSGIMARPSTVMRCCRPDPLPALRPQADAPLQRHEASDPALQLLPRLDGQWEARCIALAACALTISRKRSSAWLVPRRRRGDGSREASRRTTGSGSRGSWP